MKFSTRFLSVLIGLLFSASASFAQTVLSPEQKALMQAALRVMVVDQKLLPDYADLPSKKKINVYNKLTSMDTPDAPPVFLKAGEEMKIGKVKFLIRSEAELMDSTRKEDLLFVRLAQINEPQSDVGIVSVAGQYALGKESKARGYVFRQAMGHTLLFRKVNGQWKFEKVLVTFPNLLDYKEGF